jgi:copper chaperone CopZ
MPKEILMGKDVAHDQLAVIRVEGMHCHNCEQKLRKSLSLNDGVHEVEVDYNTGQVSVLFEPKSVSVGQLMNAVTQAGYQATGYTLAGKKNPAAH